MVGTRKRTGDMEEAKENQQEAYEKLEVNNRTSGTHYARGMVDDDKYSPYCTSRQSRPRSRCRRRHSHSRSDSQSSSSSRRRRSKWAIHKFTIGRKNVRRLNAYELIGTSIRWFLSIDGLSFPRTSRVHISQSYAR